MARILIVDGDPVSRESLERALDAEGLEVLAAADAAGAWEAFTAFHPHGAVLGRRLPAGDAEALADRMQEADPDVIVLGAADPATDLARRLRIRLGAPAPRRLPPSAATGGPGTARVLSRPPLERGELAFGALADLLARLWRGAADGIVEVDRAAGASLVFLLRGAPVALVPEAPGGNLRAGLAALCAAGSGAFHFHPGSEFAREVTRTPVPALAPLLDGLRAAAEEDGFAEALGAVAGAFPVRSSAWGALAAELDLAPEDAAIVEALDGTWAVGDLLAGRRGAASLLWFLVRAGAVELRLPAADRPAADA